MLFAYLFEEFGGTLWQPMRGSDCEIVAIPWQGREAYHQAIRALQIEFKTVWISKPRLPSFVLASAIAADDARVVLDFDDDEEHFMEKHHNREKVFAHAGLAQSRELIAATGARTAASATLQQAFGANMVRHAREPLGPVARRRPDHEFRIGFVGTAHRHKGLEAAAEAVRLLNVSGRHDRKIVLHVYGTFHPPELKNALNKSGVVTKGVVPQGALDGELVQLDALLTSYPSGDPAHAPVQKFQIPSKISDGLRLGLPVLVARWPSVEDLADVPGVVLFEEGGLAAAIGQAMAIRDEIRLPAEFTLSAAYEAFRTAECASGTQARAREVFAKLKHEFAPGP